MNMPAFGTTKGDGSAYVPNMDFHHQIDINGVTTIEIEDSAVDGATLAAVTTVAASTTYDLGADYIAIPEPFGRSVVVTSTDAGSITLIGHDYLGQRMTETLVCIVGDIAGKKAFKDITGYVTAADLAGDITIKTGAQYGLPFCAIEIVRETVDGAAATEGTITVPDTNTPTATTGDVRGTFNPNTAGDGAKDISLTYVTTAALTGGLYGQAQA